MNQNINDKYWSFYQQTHNETQVVVHYNGNTSKILKRHYEKSIGKSAPVKNDP